MVENGDDYNPPPNGWVDITPDIFRDNDPPAPFKLYANHFKSASPRLKAFIDDPRGYLTGAYVNESFFIPGDALDEVHEDTEVRTFFTNHHNTLLRMILYSTAMVPNPDSSDSENAVTLTLYKHGPKGD